MAKTVEDRLTDMQEIFAEMDHTHVADAEIFVLSDVFIASARRQAERMIDQGEDLLVQEERSSGVNYLQCAGSKPSVNKMRAFVARLTAH